jgi:putative ABC transport system permease protein
VSLLADVRERLRALFLRERAERELAEELRFHVERETDQRIHDGLSPDDARRAARLAFGGVERYREAVGDARGIRPLQDLGADIRYALRGLRRHPGFTATAVVVLALGLGASTAVFSVLRSVVLADLPYPEPDRLFVVFEQNSPTNRWALSTADVRAIQEQQHSFAAFGAVQRAEAALSGVGTPTPVEIGRVSAGFFQALGVTVARGRAIEPGDEAAGAAPVVVVSHGLAERVLGGADVAVGRSLTLDGVSYGVVGVLPAGRDELLAGLPTQAWPALKLSPPTRRGPFWLRGVGRLADGVTPQAAARDLSGISRRLLPVWSDFRDSTARLTPVSLREVILRGADRQVGLFTGAVALVLLLALTNVATLVLVRAAGRESELGLRLMLGARRARVARLLVTENVVLTLVAGVLGLGLAALGVRLAATLVPNLPRIATATLDWRAIAFALGTAVICGVLVSLSPVATLAGRMAESLRTDPRRAGRGPGTNRIRGALVAAEFALALPLLVAAGLLLNTFLRLRRVDLGFDPAGVVAVGVSLPAARYPGTPERWQFWHRAEQRIADLPGVVAGGISTQIPPDLSGNTDNFNLVDHPVPSGQAEPVAPWYYVTSGYFRGLGVRLLEGRVFTPADSNNAPPVVVVSRSWARRYFPDEDAVGRQLVQGGCYDCPRTTIVGVVADIKNLGPAAATEAAYGPIDQANVRSAYVVVRSRMGPAAALRGLRRLVGGLDPALPLADAALSQRFSASLTDPRHWAAVLVGFGVVGTGLAALGVFGLMSYVVRQRRREIGVRLALGARPGTITRLIISRGMRYAVTGSAVGLVLALLLVRRLGTLLYGVAPTDPGTIAGVAVLLLLTALLACWLPGWRAARIRPIEAMSAE